MRKYKELSNLVRYEHQNRDLILKDISLLKKEESQGQKVQVLSSSEKLDISISDLLSESKAICSRVEKAMRRTLMLCLSVVAIGTIILFILLIQKYKT